MSAYQMSRRAVLFGILPAACGFAAPADQGGRATRRTQAARSPSPPPVGEVFDVTRFGASPGASAAANTAAFAEASFALNRAGGGTLLVPPGTYRVGAQRRGRTGALAPADIIRIEGCDRPVAILGRGAALRAAGSQERAVEVLQEALDLARTLGQPTEVAISERVLAGPS